MNTMKKLAALNAKADALRASLKKDLDAAEKKVSAAKVKAEAAVKEFRQASEALASIRAAMGLKAEMATDDSSTDVQPVKAAKAAPAGVRLKKDGTPAKKPGPKKEKVAAAPKAEKKKPGPKPKAEKVAAKAEGGVRLKKDGTPAKKPGPKGSKPGPKPKAEKAVKAAKVEGGVRLKKDGTPAKKPGPKKDGETSAPKTNGAAAHLKTDGTPKKKPGPKPKAEKATKAEAAPEKKTKSGKPSRAAEGRRAVLTGERPTLKNAIKQVMGSKTMNTQEVYDALKEKNWLPNSSDPKGYVGYTLSSDKKVFERVADKGRGHYRVRPESSTAAATKAEESKAEEPKKTESKKDPILADAEDILGIN